MCTWTTAFGTIQLTQLLELLFTFLPRDILEDTASPTPTSLIYLLLVVLSTLAGDEITLEATFRSFWICFSDTQILENSIKKFFSMIPRKRAVVRMLKTFSHDMMFGGNNLFRTVLYNQMPYRDVKVRFISFESFEWWEHFRLMIYSRDRGM